MSASDGLSGSEPATTDAGCLRVLAILGSHAAQASAYSGTGAKSPGLHRLEVKSDSSLAVRAMTSLWGARGVAGFNFRDSDAEK